MKKLSVLILLVIVASLLVAAIPTKMMRLTIINKSGYDVYMKLEGSAVTDAYYYLTVPSGDRDEPVIKVFTVMSDVYSRTTWQCGGLESSGDLVVDQQIRLTFLPCGEAQCAVGFYKDDYWLGGCKNNIEFYKWENHYQQGEPTMEKVTYWKYLGYGPNAWIYKSVPAKLWKTWVFDADGYWNFGCVQYWWKINTYKLPVGCNFRYQY